MCVDLASHFGFFLLLFRLSLGLQFVALTQKKLESGSNGSYCVAMCSIVLLWQPLF